MIFSCKIFSCKIFIKKNFIHKIFLDKIFIQIFSCNITNKIFIDNIEIKELPKDLKDKSYILFQFKILCLPKDNLLNIKREFKDNNISHLFKKFKLNEI